MVNCVTLHTKAHKLSTQCDGLKHIHVYMALDYFWCGGTKKTTYFHRRYPQILPAILNEDALDFLSWNEIKQVPHKK